MRRAVSFSVSGRSSAMLRNVSGPGLRAERCAVRARLVSSRFLARLSARPILGRKPRPVKVSPECGKGLFRGARLAGVHCGIILAERIGGESTRNISPG
jgi:hypothetical protein